MKLLDEFFEIRKKIHDHFGYVEDWRVIPLDDAREYFWYEDGSQVRFAGTEEELYDDEGGNYYEHEIYTQRHLPKWVYRADDYTMICVDTNCDMNHFLQVFDNAKERKPKSDQQTVGISDANRTSSQPDSDPLFEQFSEPVDQQTIFARL